MLGRIRGRARLGLVGGLVVALVIAMTALYAVVLPSQALGAQATVTILSGTVEVRDAGAASFSTGKDLGLLGPGATLRTGSDGNALLTFFDGSTVTVEPGTELTLEQLETTGAGASFISIVQVVGRTWHVVGRTLPPGSIYSVRTTSATAVVRGTAFDFSVDEQGGATTLTEEGTVALTAQGQTVEVGPDQVAEATADAPPTQPEPAPPPDNLVKVIIDPTNSAAAVDSKGRAVGIVNGIPNITVPRGKVEFIDGKIVMTIPVSGTERVSTIVQSTDPARAVAIQTQVETKGVIVNNALEVRTPDASGFAKGGVALTTTGLIVLPDDEARRFTSPKIASAPQVGSGSPFGGPITFVTAERLKDLPSVEIATPVPGAASPATFTLPAGVTLPADVKLGEFNGGFQQFSFFGFTQNIAKQPGFDPTKATGLEFTANGVAAPPQNLSYATFNGALPPGLVPPPPPGATDAQSASGFAPPPGFSFPAVQAPAPGGAGAAPFDPASIPSFNLPPDVQQQMAQQLAQFQQIATQLQQQGAFSGPAGAQTAPGAPGTTGAQGNPLTGGGFPTLPFSPFASPGAPQGGVGPSPFQGGQLPQGCRDLGILGVVCSGPAGSSDPTQTAPNNLPPCAVGQAASSTNPCAPGGAPGVSGPGNLPPCAEGQQPSPASPCRPASGAGAAPGTGGFPALPPCAPGQLPSPTSPCSQSAGAGGTPTCPPGTVPSGPDVCAGPNVAPPPPGGAVPPPPGVALPTCPPGTTPISAGVCRGTIVPVSPPPGTVGCPAPGVLVAGVCTAPLPEPSGATSPVPCPAPGVLVAGVCTAPLPEPSGATSPVPCPAPGVLVAGVCTAPLPEPSGATSPVPCPAPGVLVGDVCTAPITSAGPSPTPFSGTGPSPTPFTPTQQPTPP